MSRASISEDGTGMILYFSGTGNSKFVAEKIRSVINDEIVSIKDLIKKNDTQAVASDSPLVFVAPCYAWRMPRLVDKFILNHQFEGNKRAYFVMTCGGQVGAAAKYLKKICDKKGFEFMGLEAVAMPGNHTAMFPSALSEEDAKRLIERSIPAMIAAAERIKTGEKLTAKPKFKGGKLMSVLINPLFYKFAIKTKGFYATDLCVSCGKCVKLCPFNSVALVNGKPQWGTVCTHCMACINNCPSGAIEYKNISKGKSRYVCRAM